MYGGSQFSSPCPLPEGCHESDLQCVAGFLLELPVLCSHLPIACAKCVVVLVIPLEGSTTDRLFRSSEKGFGERLHALYCACLI